MNNLIISGYIVSPIQLAHDFVADYSVDEAAAINLLRSTLYGTSSADINRWFEEMAVLLSLKETSSDTLIALLRAIHGMSSLMIHECSSIFETPGNE